MEVEWEAPKLVKRERGKEDGQRRDEKRERESVCDVCLKLFVF